MRGAPRHLGTSALVIALRASFAYAEVEFSLSPGPYYVGAPITLQIKVTDAPEHEPPRVPNIEGADVREGGKSSQTSMINFKVSQSVVYQYEVVPRRPGPLVIPALEIVIKGETRQTAAKTLTIEKAEGGDLLIVQVHGDRESIYLGESIKLSLEIWLKPFVDRRNNFGTPVDMESCIDFRNSSWGPFGELLKNLRQGQVPVRRAKRTDAEGAQREYYVYHLEHTVWPEQAGRLELGDVNISVQYPLQVVRDSGFFFSEPRVVRARPLSAMPEVDPLEVKLLPSVGRPPGFNGAVGRFRFRATAKPTEVHVGDPITLTLSITGGGKLELLQPPKLEEIPPLVEKFKIPDELLAGMVEGNTKTFTQTIRARTDAVTEIPAIPFSHFDTQTEKYVTLYSDPIPIQVTPSEHLAVSTIVESEGGPRVSTRLTRQGEGILANYTHVDELLVTQGFAPGPRTFAWVAAPPLVFALTTLIRQRRARLKEDVVYARRRSAKSTVLRTLNQAEGLARAAPRVGDARASAPADGRREEAALVLAALTQYVADRCGLPATSLTRMEVVEHLGRRGVSPERIRALDGVLEECEKVEYAGSPGESDASLGARARECIRVLEKERFS